MYFNYENYLQLYKYVTVTIRISAKRISDGKSLRNLKIKIPSEISHYWLLGGELPDGDKKPEESHFILLIVPTKRFYIFF